MTDSSKITLRNKRISDARNDYDWQSDHELARLDATTPITCSFEEYLVDYTDELQQPSYFRRSFAIETHDGQHIGNCVYYNINEGKGETELGIIIGDRRYWNSGYGTDAVSALIDHIFRQTKLDRIHLKSLVTNNRAHKCFQKCNLKPCGYLERDGYEFLLMEIYRAEWLELQSKNSPAL
ncbi:MAG: GNAT family N-acetyltransferase [Dehalococcoidales bacterium]|nr:MAG: GNAT family N-acetyltransferase [Dehalococcoidales bacterium]